MPKPTRGLVIGKFMPPHRGHQFLIESARQRVDELTVIVFTKSYEPIPGHVRHAWMQRLFPNLQVLNIHDDYPTDFGNPDLWQLRIAMIREVYPQGPDFVFSSEPYGDELARRLGAQAVVVDAGRAQVPVSATMIRDDPYKHWEFIPPCVRRYYAKRVVVLDDAATFGRELARRLNTQWVEDRTLSPDLEPYRNLGTELDLKACIVEQTVAESAAAEQSNRVVICQTSPLLLALHYEHQSGAGAPETMQLAAQQPYDLYLVVADGDAVDDYLVTQLQHRMQQVVSVAGSDETGLEAAVAAVEALMVLAE